MLKEVKVVTEVEIKCDLCSKTQNGSYEELFKDGWASVHDFAGGAAEWARYRHLCQTCVCGPTVRK